MKKVMAFGTFDVLHPGHRFFLTEAKKFGDYLVVVIARDETVIGLKKRPALNKEDERKINLEKLAIANKVVLGNTGTDKLQIVRTENPDIIALGYDQKFFIDKLKVEFPKIGIVRIESFRPDIFKSSKFRVE